MKQKGVFTMNENLAYKDDSYYIQLKTQLINGKVVMMSPRPRLSHIRISGRIFHEFETYLKGKKCEAFTEADVFLNKQNRFIPDVMIVCNPDILDEDGIHGAPDLVVEVLSPSTAKFDRGDKKDTYERAGVREYWIVDTISKSIEVYYNQNNRFVLHNIYQYYTAEQKAKNETLSDDDDNKIVIYDKIKVSVYDNLIVNLDDIFY